MRDDRPAGAAGHTERKTRSAERRDAAEAAVPPDLGRAIQRMFPVLSRAAVAVLRLHRLRRRESPVNPERRKP